MIKVKNEKLKKIYMEKYNIKDIFTEDMSEFMELHLYSKGEHICFQNEKIDKIYFFVKGKLKVYRTLENGKSLLIMFYYPFMPLGDVEIFNYEDADANVTAVEDSYLITLEYEKVRKILLNDVKYLKYTCESLAQKLKHTSKNGSINILYPLEERLASYIIVTSEKRNKEFIFKENLTNLAELLGCSYRHLLRTIKSLIERELIIKVDDYYKILDYKNLKTLASDLYEQ
ncbi:MAG: cyclic nucleotide-binding domain-containing protein [Clostridium sp.]|nr:cyclic nucleotide-binding domain-containing protein [Clostridium sp.]